jgi:hypothetical protein
MMVMLPLGVLATKLQRIEAELRQLSMKASGIRAEAGHAPTTLRIHAQLELIDAALDSIQELLSNFKADMDHEAPDAPFNAAERQSSSLTKQQSDDEYSSHDGARSDARNRKPYPELDD